MNYVPFYSTNVTKLGQFRIDFLTWRSTWFVPLKGFFKLVLSTVIPWFFLCLKDYFSLLYYCISMNKRRLRLSHQQVQVYPSILRWEEFQMQKQLLKVFYVWLFLFKCITKQFCNFLDGSICASCFKFFKVVVNFRSSHLLSW